MRQYVSHPDCRATLGCPNGGGRRSGQPAAGPGLKFSMVGVRTDICMVELIRPPDCQLPASTTAGSAWSEPRGQRTLLLLDMLGGISGPDRSWQPSDKACLQAEADHSRHRTTHCKEGPPRHHHDSEQAHEVIASLSIHRTWLWAYPVALFHASACRGRAGWHLTRGVASDLRS